jgi:hypothetical protein
MTRVTSEGVFCSARGRSTPENTHPQVLLGDVTSRAREGAEGARAHRKTKLTFYYWSPTKISNPFPQNVLS